MAAPSGPYYIIADELQREITAKNPWRISYLYFDLYIMLNNDIVSCGLRLDSSCIFLPSSEDLDSKVSVSGKFCFSVPRGTTVKGISVVLQGRTKLPCDESVIFNTYYEEITYERKQALASSKKLHSFSLPAGDYQFPFEITLDGNLFETIVGPHHQYHSYELYGIIERRLSRDIVVSHPIRIYNPVVFEIDGTWMSAPQSIENQWDNKVYYRISLPETNIPFGSAFPVHLFLAPLSKDLRLGALTLQVIEKHELKIRAPAAYSVHYNVNFLTSTTEHLIFSERHDSLGDYATQEGAFQVEWTTEKQVCLPRILDAATQQVNTRNIKIHHILAFTIELLDASGALSVIKGTIPINIGMTPLVISKNGTVHGLDLGKPQYDSSSPPPLYRDHKTDLLLLGDHCDHTTYVEDLADTSRGIGHIHDEIRCDFAPSYETIMGAS